MKFLRKLKKLYTNGDRLHELRHRAKHYRALVRACERKASSDHIRGQRQSAVDMLEFASRYSRRAYRIEKVAYK